MNTVTLTRKTVGVGTSEQAEEAFIVDVSLPSAEPFPGPHHQDWCKFRAESQNEASFIWRTGAQRFVAMAEAVAEGRVAIKQALRSYLVRRYLDARPDDESEDQGVEEHQGEDRGPEARLLARALAEQSAILNTGDDQSFYSGDNDDYLHDAARTLPLPPWARYARGAPGGIASDYVEPLILLEVGKRLEDLARWIGRWEASPRLRKAVLATDVPFLPFVSGEQQRFRVTPGAKQVGAGARTEHASIFRIVGDYVFVEQRGFLSMRRLQGGPLKGPAGAALAALVKDLRKGNARIEEFRGGRWKSILRQVQRGGMNPEAV